MFLCRISSVIPGVYRFRAFRICPQAPSLPPPLTISKALGKGRATATTSILMESILPEETSPPLLKHLVGENPSSSTSDVSVTRVPEREGLMSRLLTSFDHPGSQLMPRRLSKEAAVLVVDMVDSTRFLEEVERRGISPGLALEQVFEPLIRAIRNAGGEFAGIVGDAMSAVFTREPAAWGALNAALTLRECRIQDTESSLPRPCMRIGLSFGRIEYRQVLADVRPRVVGSAVNRAFHCASGKSFAEKLPGADSSFTIFLDRQFCEQINPRAD